MANTLTVAALIGVRVRGRDQHEVAVLTQTREPGLGALTESAAAVRGAGGWQESGGNAETPGDVELTNFDDEPEDDSTSEFNERLEKLEGKVFAPVTAPTFDIGGRIHAGEARSRGNSRRALHHANTPTRIGL